MRFDDMVKRTIWSKGRYGQTATRQKGSMIDNLAKEYLVRGRYGQRTLHERLVKGMHGQTAMLSRRDLLQGQVDEDALVLYIYII